MKGKMFPSILLTALCALVILMLGYGGIVLGGQKILMESGEPELVTMKGTASNLFYSQLEDDIQLYPWNYYPEQDLGGYELFEKETIDMGEIEFYDNLEYSLYEMIGQMTETDSETVRRWYEKNGTSVYQGIVAGYDSESDRNLYFYQETLELKGKCYQVKVSFNSWQPLSFTCIYVGEAGESVDASSAVEEAGEREGYKPGEGQWESCREELTRHLEEDTWIFNAAFASLYVNNYSPMENWWDDVDWCYQVREYQREMEEGENDNVPGKIKRASGWKEIVDSSMILDETYEKDPSVVMVESEEWIYVENLPIQMIELPDSILLVQEQNVPMGIYIDVSTQKICGFHFFQFMY